MAVPLPRYKTAKCCENRQHITNFGTPDLEMSVKLARRRSEVALMGLGNDNADTGRYEILDGAEELGEELQFAQDGVHLTDATYNKMADLLVKKAVGESGCAGTAPARARVLSIITEPTAATREPAAQAPAPIPAWIRGEDDQNSWRGRGGRRPGGRFNNGGRGYPCYRGRGHFHPYQRGGY